MRLFGNNIKANWVAAGLLMLFGIAAVGDWSSIKWVAVTLFLYSLPLMTQFFRSRLATVYGLWFGVFLVGQTIVTPIVTDDTYVTLEPNLSRRINVIGDALPGVSGLQSITTDSMGFRVTRQIDYEKKPENAFRVFAIGGSTTEQIILDDQRTWTHLLQERLNDEQISKDFEVINTGVSGLRAMHHLATFNRIVDFQPDLVLFLVGVNDWNRHIHLTMGGGTARSDGLDFRKSLLGKALDGLYNLVTMRSRIGDLVPDSEVETFAGEYYSNQNNSLARTDVRSFHPTAVLKEYENWLDKIGSACEREHVVCMFVTQPSGYHSDATEELRRHFWMTPPNTSYTLDFDSLVGLATLYNSHLLAFAEENGYQFCDLAAIMESSTRSFFDDCHFNFEGAVAAATYLHRCIAI